MEKEHTPNADKKTTPIAYIGQIFPSLTESFVYREVMALREAGFDIETFAIWKPDKNKLSHESRHLVADSTYVFPIHWRPFIGAHLYFLVTHPLKYLGTLFFVLTRKGESLDNRRRTFLHFCEAVYLAREMQRKNIRHIHAHFTITAASVALMIARLLGISFSFTAHNIFYINRLLIKEKIREAKFMAVISEFSREMLAGFVPGEGHKDKMHIVHCGVSPEKFIPPDPKPANKTPILLFVAQLAERKGAPYLVEACRILAERKVDFHCVIVGNGPEMPLVKQLVAQYGLEDTVELTGALFQEQLKPYLNKTDIFVLPCVTASDGDMDGIPVSLMEAMAMEIATVSTYVSGIPELIENGKSGLLVKEKDPLALADVLQQLLESKSLREELGKEGRQKVVEAFNTHKNIEQLAALYQHYLDIEIT
ncbi:MAG: glycosyltransferase [Anaerolineae bacterium]|nr:glycosyltransferase [Anaerolineae bacterium]